MSIATKLASILQCKADIKDAIEAKGVTVGSASLDQYASKISQISGGGSTEAPENDVNFYDYDGFRVASYTIAEAKALTQAQYNAILPPTHEGLTFQEWNWTLADIQGYNRRYIDIGAHYVPTDGKTHFVFDIENDNTFIQLSGNINTASSNIQFDWGDGTVDNVSTLNANSTIRPSHTYTLKGKYVLKLKSLVTNVTYSFSTWSNEAYKYCSEINLSSEVHGISVANLFCKISVPNIQDFKFSIYRCVCPQITINKTWNIQSTDSLNSLVITCLPASISSANASRIFGMSYRKYIIPEVEQNGIFLNSSISPGNICRILSIPLSLQWSAAPAGNQFVSMVNLDTIDVANGWTPNYSFSFSTATTRMTAQAMVDFFNKLGTTESAITITFGTTNLNKLTADQKAIATNKGYTLA